jgi:hypothetical protein
VAQRSRLLIAVEDKYPDQSAILRNKMTDLTVRQGGQETEYPLEQLPKSLYQQVSPLGYVLYQNETPSFEQFAQLGVPVDTTLLLPKLPERPVRVGDRWVSSKERLDMPGTPPNQQPIVAMESTFEGLEWEGGYPTAKIHQVFDSSKGGFKTPKSIIFGNIPVESPQIKYERDIYIAYRSGTLVKMVRTMEVTGKSGSAAEGAGAAGMRGGGAAMMGSGGPMAAGGLVGAGGPPGGAAGYGSMMQQQMQRQMGASMRRGSMGPGGMGPGGGGAPRMGSGGMSGAPMAAGGGNSKMGAMMGSGSGAPMRGMGRQGMAGPGMAGGPGMMVGGGFGGGAGSGSSQITLKSKTITELDRSGTVVAGL